MGGVEYQVTKVDPTDPQTKGAVYQVHKVSEEIAATLGGKVYRARIIKDPTAPTVAGKVYQIVLIDDPDDPSVKGKVYNAILTGGSEAVVVGPGASPLDLPDAVAEAIDSLIAYGGTEQNGTPTPSTPVDIVCNNGTLKATRPSGLPAGYTALEYIESSGTQYIDLGYKGNGSTKVEIKFKYHTTTSASGSGRVFGSRNAAAVDAFAIGSASGTASTNSTVAFFFGNQSYLVTDKSLVLDEWLDVVFDKTTHSINGIDYGDPYNDETFETPQNLKLFGFDNNGTMGYGYVDVAYCKLWNNGVLVRDLIPAKNSSGVLGLYDRANNQFYDNDGTGDFVAGPNAVDPITLVVEGTEERIAVTHNEFDPTDESAQFSGYVQNVAVGSMTRLVAYNGGDKCLIFPVKAGNTYRFTRPTNVGAVYDRIRVAASVGIPSASTTDNMLMIFNLYGNQTTPSGTFTIPEGYDYIAINVRNSGAVGTDWQTYLDGVSFCNLSESSVTCENLFAVGDYVDSQDVISGEVTHKIGVKALDGTEGWQLATATDLVQFYTSSTQGVIANNVSLASTIAPYGCTVANRTQYDFGCYSGGSGNLCFQMKGSATLTTTSAWTQYLADQYAAGTPVIVVYPLATPTTETVMGQPMETTDGDNVAEITQASIDGLQLKVEYEKEAE